MPAAAISVTVHASQFPAAVRGQLLESLRSRRVNHKFHYDSAKQTLKWLAVHETCSPARTDADCLSIYETAFKATAETLPKSPVHLISIGCGGGQKDAILARQLATTRAVHYTPTDVSMPMVIVAAQAVQASAPVILRPPAVFDLAEIQDLSEVISEQPGETRLVACFGMVPNFEPGLFFPSVTSLLRAGDYFLMSANLAPGSDYSAGVRQILPQYDNEPTREWLLTFLLDLGVNREAGQLLFSIEPCPHGSGLQRVEANFAFSTPTTIHVESESFQFKAGESIRLFFSYRNTPQSVRTLLKTQGVTVSKEWISGSGEEGVFLCQKAG